MKQAQNSKSLASVYVALKIFGIGLLVYWFIGLFTIPSYAQESSPSGSLIEKLNALKEDIASKAAQIKKEVSQKVQNKAIIGTILDITSSEITIKTLNSDKIVKYDEFTEVFGLKNKKIKLTDLEDNDKIAALGDLDDKNNLVAKRLIYLEPASLRTASSSAELVWGQIQKSTGATITVKTKDGKTENVLTNSQTQFFLGNNEATTIDAKVEKYLLTRATRLKDGTLRARFIYFIPSVGFTKPTEKSLTTSKIATPSASVKR